MTVTRDAGGRAATKLLRQLGIAFTTYRLYPGDLAQPALAGAVERLAEIGAEVLAAGPLDVAVRGAGLHLGAEPVDDDRADRLADACFQRRVQHLRIRAVPSLGELDAFFGALTRSPPEVEAAGGVNALLAARGVRALVASEGVPEPDTGRPDPQSDIAARESADRDVAPADPDEALPPLAPVAGESARDLYERLRTVSDALADDVSARSSFFRRAARLAADLPEPERLAFSQLVLGRGGTEPFAERYVGHLTDVDLAAVVAEVAESHGEDPVNLAVDTATVTGRHDALVRLVEQTVARAATRARAPGEPAAGPEERLPAGPEGRRLRDGFPAAEDDGRAVALTTLQDYLRADPEPQQAERVAAAAADQLRTDVREQGTARLRDLLAALAAAELHTRHDVFRVVATAPERALTSAVLVELAESALPEGAEAAAEVLEPFGPAAVEALVEALADESRQAVRGVLVGVLAAVVADEPARLEPHLADRRWFVARNLASALRRVGGSGALPLLERLAAHPHHAVRQEALHALAALPAEHAAPALARLAGTYDQREEQEACLHALAALGTPPATRLLEDLGSRRPRRRLPWSLRRQARALARRGSDR